MYAFQICNIPSKDDKILHYEFLGCISESDSDEGEEEEREGNKRGKFLDDHLNMLTRTTDMLHMNPSR